MLFSGIPHLAMFIALSQIAKYPNIWLIWPYLGIWPFGYLTECNEHSQCFNYIVVSTWYWVPSHLCWAPSKDFGCWVHFCFPPNIKDLLLSHHCVVISGVAATNVKSNRRRGRRISVIYWQPVELSCEEEEKLKYSNQIEAEKDL